MENDEALWKDYQQAVELHRHYLELAIKLNIFYYAITGAILSFYFANTDIPMVKYALCLPLLLSSAFSYLFFHSAVLAQNLRIHIRATAEKLRRPFYPEGIVLVLICAIFGSILAIVSIALIYLFWSS